MADNKQEPSGAVETASKHVGICVGKAAAVGRKIAALGSRGTAAVGSLLTRPLKRPAPVTEEDIGLTSQAYISESDEASARENAAGAPAAALVSDLAKARRELEEARAEAEKSQSQLASQLGQVQAGKQSLIRELKRAQHEAGDAKARNSAVRAGADALEAGLAEAKRKKSSRAVTYFVALWSG